VRPATLAALATLLLAPIARAGEAVRRRFDVPGRGTLDLVVPEGWRASWESLPNEAAVLQMKPPEAAGKGFAVLLKPMSIRDDPEKVPDLVAEALARETGKGMLDGAVEKELLVEEIRGPDAVLYCTTLADRKLAGKKPGPDDWTHVTHCGVAVGALLVSALVLEDGADGPGRRAAIGMLKTARHVPVPRDGGR